jgi:hypothetical protein
MVRASLCERCQHAEGCDLKPNERVRNLTACNSFSPTRHETHEEIIEKLDLIRMKKIPVDKSKPPV